MTGLGHALGHITPSSFPYSSVVSNDTSMFMAVKAFPNLFRLRSGCLWQRRMGEGLPPETSAVFIFAAVPAATLIVSLAHQSHSVLRNSSLSSSANMQSGFLAAPFRPSLDPLETREWIKKQLVDFDSDSFRLLSVTVSALQTHPQNWKTICQEQEGL